jgi:hypothetical protein
MKLLDTNVVIDKLPRVEGNQKSNNSIKQLLICDNKMPVSVKLPSEFQGIFQNLFKQDPMEGTIRLVLNELRKKLAEYTLMDKIFRERYKMDFGEFKRKQVVESLDYSFNVEEDFCDWELAIDGIKSITTELKKLTKYS